MRSIEHVKRFTTNGMATDQGKTANLNALAIVAAPIGVTPSRMVTVPVAADGTVPENVTAAPDVEGLGVDASVTVTDALSTTCDNGADVLGALLRSPL